MLFNSKVVVSTRAGSASAETPPFGAEAANAVPIASPRVTALARRMVFILFTPCSNTTHRSSVTKADVLDGHVVNTSHHSGQQNSMTDNVGLPTNQYAICLASVPLSTMSPAISACHRLWPIRFDRPVGSEDLSPSHRLPQGGVHSGDLNDPRLFGYVA
jgi:pyruvate/2-oxoglutarate dehydrogenase complex dihydrolipoamide acyltransferase (E2) component